MGKKSDILLVQLPPWDPQTYPLGIAYIATFLKSKGIAAEVFDLNIYMYNTKTQGIDRGWDWVDDYWWKSNKVEGQFLPWFEEFTEKILDFDVQVIGFSANQDSIVFLNCLLRYIKRKSPDKKIVVVGPGVFFEKVRISGFAAKMIDYFIIGDGELALYKLLYSLNEANGFNLDKDKTCKIWKDAPEGKTICLQEKVMDLDSISHPTFEEFDPSMYKEADSLLPIIFSKGCSRHCVFCADTVISAPLRFRSAEKVVDEIKYHLKKIRM